MKNFFSRKIERFPEAFNQKTNRAFDLSVRKKET